MALNNFNLGDVGGIFTSLREAITGEKIQDPTQILKQIGELETTFLRTQGRIIEAEAKSEHWIVSAWRPLTMLVFVFIIANNYILVPYANMFLTEDIKPLELTNDMWEILKIGLGGYVLGRSAEKFAKNWKGK